VREVLGIPFEGSAFPEAWPLYDIHLNDPLYFKTAHVSLVKRGRVFLLGSRTGLWRVFADVSDPLDRLPPGTARGNTEWQSSFHISHRLAAQEALGCVVLAGDAAHIHSPVAARGMKPPGAVAHNRQGGPAVRQARPQRIRQKHRHLRSQGCGQRQTRRNGRNSLDAASLQVISL
jgi:hypothetical protein